MPLLHLVILAVIQGITEFLPISSSGHLVLTHNVLHHDSLVSGAQSKLMDMAVHLGTLIAVCTYFYKDLWALICGGIDLIAFRDTPNRQKAVLTLCASIPVIIVGLLLHKTFGADVFDNITVIGWTTLLFGIALWFFDRRQAVSGKPDQDINDMSLKHSVFIGIAQCLALIPGTSRSGITMTASRALGFSRTESARFSMWLGMVAISGAGVLSSFDIIAMENHSFGLDTAIAAALSALSAFIAIALMMRWLARASFLPFAIYRVLLGGALLGLSYSGAL